MAASFQGFGSLVEHSPDAISVIDSKGEILYGSASTTSVFGYRPEEIVGRNCLDLIHQEDREHSRQVLTDVLAQTGPLQWDARILNKDGHYSWVENTVSNLLADKEVHALVVHQRNIDVRKAEEEERKRRAEELVRSNTRLEEFAYTAAHDLREPLRAISAYTTILVQEMQLDEASRQMAKFIVEGTTRMSTLIDDLLSFASTGMHEPPSAIDLQEVVRQATENLALEIRESGAKITIDRLPVVRGNQIHLVRLLQNLIGNAVKYRGEASPEVHVGAAPLGSDWAIRVEDNGVGIAAKNQERVFMPFVRLGGREVPGTGLGLSVCKNIVEGLGGKISLESQPGVGSTFSFTIAGTTGVPAGVLDRPVREEILRSTKARP